MKPDAMLVEPQCLADALNQLAAAPNGALTRLATQEPVLAGFVQESLEKIAGRLTLVGAPRRVVQGVYQDVVGLVLASVQALRLGHYRLWQDCTPAEKLPPPDLTSPPRQRKARRRRGPDDGRENNPS